MGMSSNCMPNHELPVQLINTLEEYSCVNQGFLEDTTFDAQGQSASISQDPLLSEPSTSSASGSKNTWLGRWSNVGGVNKFVMWLMSFCLPMNNSSFTCSGSISPIMVCVPSNPSITQESQEPPKKKLKPVGLITRLKEFDFIGGKIIGGCTCGRKNGLSGDCKRISCRDNPGCFMNPPQCWPQFKEPPPPPPPPPPQKLICVPIELVYADPPGGKTT